MANRWRIFDGESEQGFRQIKDRVYPAGQDATLSDMSMQEGDTLPDDSDYEIISSVIEMVKPLTTAQGKHNGGRAVRIKAVKFKVEATAQSTYLWEELSGSRVFDDTDPQTVKYQITFVGLTASAVPAIGSLYIAFPGAGTLTSTNLDREPVAVHISQKKKATVLKSFITVTFQAYHARTTTSSPGTEINSRVLIRTGRNSWKGTRRFTSTVTNAGAVDNALYGSVFPNKSGKYAPKCMRTEIHDEPPNMPGRSLIIAQYETPRVVGEGKLRIISGYTQSPATKDISTEKKQMFGPERYLSGTTPRWGERRIVKGNATLLEPMTTIILETAATAFNVNVIMDRQNMVNKYKLPNFGNAQPGTLLFLGSMPQTTFQLGDDLWYVDLAFKYSGNPEHYPIWNERTESQLGTYVPRRMQEVGADENIVVGAFKTVLQWIPRTLDKDGNINGFDEEPTTHKRHAIADFTDLGKHLTITGIS